MAGQNGKHVQDPAAVIPGAPPNLGEPVMPHVMSFAGIVSNLAKVYRPSDEAVMDNPANARFMRNDPVIMECIEARQRCGALLDWHIEPEDEKDLHQKEVADGITRIIEAMPRFMQYRENLANATFFGKYGVSQTWQKKMIRRKMYTAVTKWTPVHGDKIVFRFDNAKKIYDDSLVGIRCGIGLNAGDQIGQDWRAQPVGGSGGMMPTDQGMAYFLPKWQRSLIAIHKHQIEDGEFESPQYAGRIHGVGIRSRIYWLWYQKQETLAWLMEYLERSAAGFEIWYYQWGNPDSEAKARKAAQERIGNRNVVLVPKVLGDEGGMGEWYQRIEPSMAGAEAMKSIIIEYFGALIKRCILGQTLTTEAAGTGLGSNLADVHMDTFMQIVKYDCRLLQETVTDELVKHIVRYDFPAWVNYDFKFKIKTEEDDVQDKLDSAKAAYEMGLRIPAKKIYEITSITPPEEGEEVLSMAQQQGGQPGMGQPGDPAGAAGAGGLPPGMTARFGADLASKLGQALETKGPDVGAMNGSVGTAEDYAAAGGSEPIKADQLDRAAFRRGLSAEMKETKDHTLASEIVLDNLQRDPRHYDMQALMAAGNAGDGLFTPPSQDSERSRLATYAKFNESDHPRDDDGQFSKEGKSQPLGTRKERISSLAKTLSNEDVRRLVESGSGIEKEAAYLAMKTRPSFTSEYDQKSETKFKENQRLESARDFKINSQKQEITNKLVETGWKIEHSSDSGSVYFEKSGKRIRVSDHFVPETDERIAASEAGKFSWTRGLQIILPVNDIRQELHNLLNDDALNKKEIFQRGFVEKFNKAAASRRAELAAYN